MITEATPYDIGQLGKLGKGFIDRSITGQFISFNEEGFVNSLFKMLSLGVMKVWVYKDQNRISGAIGLLMIPNLYNPLEMLGDIAFVDVLPEYQKKGIARELISLAEKFAKSVGIKSLTISFKGDELVDIFCKSYGYCVLEHKLIKKVGD